MTAGRRGHEPLALRRGRRARRPAELQVLLQSRRGRVACRFIHGAMPAAALRQVNRSGIGHATVAGPSTPLRAPAMSQPISANDGARPSRQAAGPALRAAHANPGPWPRAAAPVRVAA